MPSLEQPSAGKRRQILGHLPRKEFQRLTDLYELGVEDRRKRSLYVDALIEANKDIHILLSLLDQEQLQRLARSCKLDPAGLDKQQLIDAVLANEFDAGSAGVPPASDQLILPDTAAAAPKPAKPARKARCAAEATPERSSHAELLRQLWEAAVHLRGSIEPADYKRYVLPIIFLRFLSVRFEQRRIELADEVREPASPYYAESEEEAAFVLKDDDSYRSANVFPVPAEARWEEIRKHAQADDVKIRLDRALEALEEAYPLKLKGLLPRVFAGSNLSRENVTGLINLFSRDVFSADHGGADMLGKVYEYFIGEFADSEGKRGGEYFTPVSIVRTLVAMLEPERGVVFDPCCGSGGMFVQADEFTRHNRRLSFYGQPFVDSKEALEPYGVAEAPSFTASTATSSSATSTSTIPTPRCAPTTCCRNPAFFEHENGLETDRLPDKGARLPPGEFVCGSAVASNGAASQGTGTGRHRKLPLTSRLLIRARETLTTGVHPGTFDKRALTR